MNYNAFCASFRFDRVMYGKYRMSDCRTDGSPFHYIAHLLSGNATITEGKKKIIISSGDWFYIPYKSPYQAVWQSEDSLVWDSYGFIYFPDPAGHDYSLQTLNATDEAGAIAAQIDTSKHVVPKNVGLLYQLLSEFQLTMERADSDPGNLMVECAVDFMKTHESFRAAEVAAVCCISESELYRLFRIHAGCTPVRMHHRILAEKAADLLMNTDRSIEEISSSLGFCSTIYFRRILREVYGKTPTEIRRESVF